MRRWKKTVEGGELFKDIGEDIVIDGFRKIRDLETPIDSKAPEFGPKTNQLVFFWRTWRWKNFICRKVYEFIWNCK